MARHKDVERDQIRSETRRRLLAAAIDEFARKGYAGASVDLISQSAGFAKGTLYNYFDGKQALMRAVIDEVARDHLAYISRGVHRETDPARRLARFFEAGFAFVAEYMAKARVMIATLYNPGAPFNPHMLAAYGPMFQLVHREILAPGIAAGIFRPVDPDATATLLMTLYLGAGSQVDEAGRPWLDPAQVASFAWHALCQDKSIVQEE
jgi:AcrR family transcriptional regulator